MKNKGLSAYILPCATGALYCFLYIPICILIIFSFNSVAFPSKWVSFSLRWYEALVQDPEIWFVTFNSLIIALSSVFLSLVIGVCFVFYASFKRWRYAISTFYANLMIPEIILAVSLLGLFSFFSVPLSITTVIMGHTVLGLGYVVPIVYTRLQELDKSILEASLDLGASIHQTFFFIVLPFLMPALVVSGLLVFIISLDDFLIAFFCAGPSAQTLSIYVFSMMRIGINPTLNALSTIMLVFSSAIVFVFTLLRSRIRIF